MKYKFLIIVYDGEVTIDEQKYKIVKEKFVFEKWKECRNKINRLLKENPTIQYRLLEKERGVWKEKKVQI